jgi:large subunit ribosomal protein L25
MATTISVKAAPRDKTLKAAALRRTGQVPGVIYGHGFEAKSVQFDYRNIELVIQHAGTSRLVTVNLDGETHDTFIRDIQRDPITRQILHVDMLAVVASETMRNMVPIVQHGEAPVTELGGVIVQILDNLQVECLPRDMPAEIVVDISSMEGFDSLIRVADLAIPAGVTVLDDPDSEVISVTVPRATVEEEAEVVEESAAEEEAGEE